MAQTKTTKAGDLHEEESVYPFCEECGCRITIGRCKHGVRAPILVIDKNSRFEHKAGAKREALPAPTQKDETGQMEPHPSITERIIQAFICGKPDDLEATRLADAAPRLLEQLKSALPLIDDAFHQAKKDFSDAPHVAECFRLQAEAARAAISKAEGRQ